MEIEILKKKYEALQDKYKLPKFDSLESEFHLGMYISDRKEIPENILLYLAGLMLEYLNGWVSYCHNFVMGNPQSMILMQESQFFSEEKKKEIIGVMTELTVISRHQSYLYIKNREKETAEFIKMAYEKWLAIKPKLLEYSKTNLEKWKEHAPEEMKN
jgi:hypothetical protein